MTSQRKVGNGVTGGELGGDHVVRIGVRGGQVPVPCDRGGRPASKLAFACNADTEGGVRVYRSAPDLRR